MHFFFENRIKEQQKTAHKTQVKKKTKIKQTTKELCMLEMMRDTKIC